jgi:hypothetical protein
LNEQETAKKRQVADASEALTEKQRLVEVGRR